VFHCKITPQGTTYAIAVSPFLPDHKYALYVFARNIGAKTFSRAKIYPYQDSGSFVFAASGQHEELFFRYFIRNKKNKPVFNATTSTIGKTRLPVATKNLDFRNSFDLDAINDYVTPVKYQKINDNGRHYIIFNGALNKNFKRYPTFHRHTWSPKLGSNTLNIYDASVDPSEDYLLGWYHGTQKRPLCNDIQAIVNLLKEQKNLHNGDLVFYGSSGGGWAALRYASMFPGSLAVAVNPQTNILKYQYESSILKFLSKSYPGMERKQVESALSSELKIDHRPFVRNTTELKSRFIIAQNTVDEHHYQHHFLPFWQNFSTSPTGGWDSMEHNYAIIYDHPSGHSAETDDVLSKIQEMIATMSAKAAIFVTIAASAWNAAAIDLMLI